MEIVSRIQPTYYLYVKQTITIHSDLYAETIFTMLR